MLDYLADLRGGVDRDVRDAAGRALRRAARPAGARALDGQPPEARPDPGVHARARAADPRRADRRARPARPAELPRAAGRGRGAGADGLPVVAHAVARSSGSPTALRSSARAGSSSSTRSKTCGRSRSAARDRVRGRARRRSTELRAAARRPARSTIEGSHFIVAYEGSADPLVKALAAYEVRSIRSRDDDLEEIFLRYYREARSE